MGESIQRDHRPSLGWLWTFSVLALLPYHHLYNVPLVLMALYGIYVLARQPARLLPQQGSKDFLLLFACMWFPMLLSLPDAENLRSLKTVVEFLRFPLAGLLMMESIRFTEQRKKLWLGITWLCLFWALDGLLQAMLGKNLFGFPVQPGAEPGNYFITGMFYPHFTLGHVLAILFPLYLEGLRRFFRPLKLWRVLLAIPVIMAVLLTGRRAAWIMLALSSLGYAIHLWHSVYRGKSKRFLAASSVFLLLFALISGLLYRWDDNFANRVRNTIPDPAHLQQSLTEVTSLRTWIWDVSLRMYQDHWLNGVGPRGFRYVYSEYARSNDPFAQSGQTHSHMTLLEIATETGSIGLLGYMLFLGLLWKTWRKNHLQDTSHFTVPLLIAILVCVFPFNTAKAIYSSFLATLLWWLVALFVAAAHARNPHGERHA